MQKIKSWKENSNNITYSDENDSITFPKGAEYMAWKTEDGRFYLSETNDTDITSLVKEPVPTPNPTPTPIPSSTNQTGGVIHTEETDSNVNTEEKKLFGIKRKYVLIGGIVLIIGVVGFIVIKKAIK